MENRVGFWLRVAAYLIDFVLVAVLAVLAKPLVASLFPAAIDRAIAEQMEGGRNAAAMESARGFLTGFVAWGVAANLIGLLYGLIEGFTGWSPGKLILGLRVVDESGQRSPIGKLLLRFAVKQSGTLLGVVGIVAGIGILSKTSQWVGVAIILGFFLVLTKAKQALHDKIAATAVLRKSDVGVTAAAPTPATSL